MWSRKHLPCIVHSLQLVVRKFENDQSSTAAFQAAIDLVNYFRHSSAATSRLKELSNGKTLRSHCKTRWSSLYRMVQRLLELQQQITMVCEEFKIEGLLHSHWNNLGQILQVLEPFADHTTSLEAYKSTTLSLVVPAIQDLINHLQKMISEGVCKHGATILLEELQTRFKRFMNPEIDEFDPTLIIATSLDPRYKCVLRANQIRAASNALISEMKKNTSPTENNPVDNDNQNAPTSSKRFKNVVFNQYVQNPNDNSSGKAIDDEVKRYVLDESILVQENCDPTEYWQSCVSYPKLVDYALDFLIVPASSSASETLFSHAGFLSAGMRSRISAANLENQILIKCNRHLLM